MNYQQAPNPPPVNDALYKALSPQAPQVKEDDVKLQQIMQKYGKSRPAQAPRAPRMQWVGDNHA